MTDRDPSAYDFSHLQFWPRRGGGTAARLTFPNGYGISVVSGPATYGGPDGLYELAVLHEGRIVYDTPVTTEVLGGLSEGDVTERLNEVARLPPRSP